MYVSMYLLGPDVSTRVTSMTAVAPKFSNTLTLSQLRGADHAQPLTSPHLNFFVITPLNRQQNLELIAVRA